MTHIVKWNGLRVNSRPYASELELLAPSEIWRSAEIQAERSPNFRFKTGAVIFRDSRRPQILAKGCSHNHDGGMAIRSIHAEHDALQKLAPDHEADCCLVVTLTKAKNYSSISKPCKNCTNLLREAGISNVIYCERANDGSWLVRREDTSTMVATMETRYNN